jgi:energy-coupling factor transport system substrate-specific component
VVRGDGSVTIAKRAIPALLAVGVGLNVLGGLLVDFLKLPIFLDTTGTMLVAVVAGPWWGAVTGLLSNAVLAIWIPNDLWFGIANAAVGLVVGFIVRRRGFKDYLTPLLAGLAAGVVAALVGTAIATYLLGDISGGVLEAATAGLTESARTILASSFLVRLFENIVDKLIAIYIVFYITRAAPGLAPDPPSGFVDPIKRAET